MTVRELIAELQKQPPDAMVVSDGCDCVGLATGVELHENHVYLRRRDGSGYYLNVLDLDEDD